MIEELHESWLLSLEKKYLHRHSLFGPLQVFNTSNLEC
jgi:hypothetical protein